MKVQYQYNIVLQERKKKYYSIVQVHGRRNEVSKSGGAIHKKKRHEPPTVIKSEVRGKVVIFVSFGGRTSCFKNVKQEHKRPALFGYGSKQPLWFYLPSHSNKRARGEKLVNFRAENIIIIAEASSATSPPLFFTGETFLNKIKKKKNSLFLSFFV